MIQLSPTEFAFIVTGAAIVAASIGALIFRVDPSDLRATIKQRDGRIADLLNGRDDLERNAMSLTKQRDSAIECFKLAQAHANETENVCQDKLQRVITAANVAAETLEKALEEATS